LLIGGFDCGVTSAEVKEPEMVALPFEPLLIALAGKGKTIGPETPGAPT